MKRAIGALIVRWLKKPENQRKLKRTARQLWQKRRRR
ncbi:hypothetical protein C7446_3240 [Kushneria sinocarnis]|uniref:Uncharacterized protein n=1 Tax=Kushneria sinocarnis TaxID=595502 RepID=A0A420WT64_9GAMM|nr:hypothetical protein C7446_3240 [Kushneria sinocarnis]